MKNIILLALLLSASSVTYAEIIGSGVDQNSGQHCQWVKIENDGTGNKTESDGTGNKVGGDGSNVNSESEGSTNESGDDGTGRELESILICT